MSVVFCYDANGNMTQRIEGSDTYTFTYDDENRLVTGVKNGVTLASYTYDGDGKRVKAEEGVNTTYYIGDYYEWRTYPTVKAVKYYYAAGQRIAMRQGGVLTWLLGDHLDSTTITANENGTLATEQRYTAWGQTRSGSVTTDRQYTGQISEPQLGIYFYNARYYDPSIMQWTSPDTLIPDPYSPLDWNRYLYARANPIQYSDPSGHFPWIPLLIGGVGIAAIAITVAIDILSVAPAQDNRAPMPTSSDMTGWLTDRINENAAAPLTQALKENFTSGDPIKIAGATKAWVALVRATGTWDYKTDIINAKIKDGNDNITLCGDTLNFQAIANIHYGAMGRAAGIPQSVLESGAGAFQIYDNWGSNAIGTPSTYFDEPFDNWMVNFGGWLYDQYGDQFGKLTNKQLEEAYRKYKEEHGSPGQPGGGGK